MAKNGDYKLALDTRQPPRAALLATHLRPHMSRSVINVPGLFVLSHDVKRPQALIIRSQPGPRPPQPRRRPPLVDPSSILVTTPRPTLVTTPSPHPDPRSPTPSPRPRHPHPRSPTLTTDPHHRLGRRSPGAEPTARTAPATRAASASPRTVINIRGPFMLSHDARRPETLIITGTERASRSGRRGGPAQHRGTQPNPRWNPAQPKLRPSPTPARRCPTHASPGGPADLPPLRMVWSDHRG